MDADTLIRKTEETGKKVAELGRTLRHEKGLARISDKRKAAVDNLLIVVEAADSSLSQGLRAFEDAILK